jgi:ferredoxin-type protein NapH
MKGKKMNNQQWRTLSRVFLMLLVAVHLVSWYTLGIHAVGSIGIEALFSGLTRGVLNAGFIFWMLAFISAVLLGRVFCGWFCWFGGYLELVEWGIGDKLKIKIPKRILLYLGVVPFVALGLKAYSAWLSSWIIKGLPAEFIFQLADVEPWGGQQTGISIMITLILYGPILFFIFGHRAWCRYLCPIGALLKIFSSVKIGKLRLVNEECIGCGRCNRICQMQVDVMGDLNTFGEVHDPNCIVCLRCTDECPSESVALSFKRKVTPSLSADAASRAARTTLKRRKLSALDVFIAVMWIILSVGMNLSGLNKNAPQWVKVTMTPGLLIIIYGLAVIGERARNRFIH